ncbi:hypothetical protein B0H14DRAFT_3706533 [Mycena olivaceomarginata]|nr:hypothetical protein B0H14DRAFT_3706533 [Mycena olivaceomarginata]
MCLRSILRQRRPVIMLSGEKTPGEWRGASMITEDNAGSRELLDVGREWQDHPGDRPRSAQCTDRRQVSESWIASTVAAQREILRSDHRVRSTEAEESTNFPKSQRKAPETGSTLALALGTLVLLDWVRLLGLVLSALEWLVFISLLVLLFISLLVFSPFSALYSIVVWIPSNGGDDPRASDRVGVRRGGHCELGLCVERKNLWWRYGRNIGRIRACAQSVPG